MHNFSGYNMTEKQRRAGYPRLSRLHVIIGLIAAIMFFAPAAIGMFHDGAFRWTVVETWFEKIGEAGLIATIFAYILDSHTIQSIRNCIDEQSKRISEDMFKAVLGNIVDKDLFSAFDRTVLRCPVFRDQVKLHLTLTFENQNIGGVDKPFLKCEWHEQYLVHSLQSPSAVHVLDIAISTDEVKEMEGMCGITRVCVGNIATNGAPFVGKEPSEPGMSRYRKPMTVLANQPMSVESLSICYKSSTDAETFEMNMPSKNVELEIKVVGGFLNVRGHVMCGQPTKTGWKHGRDGISHWMVDGAMLPHQGIALSWSPA